MKRSTSRSLVKSSVPYESAKWKDYLARHVLLPLPASTLQASQQVDTHTSSRPVPPSDTVPDAKGIEPPRTGRMMFYCLHIKRVSGFRLPEQVKKSVRSKQLSCRLHVSFFHETSKRFFGRTWQSASMPLSMDNSIEAQHLYFRSSINDDQCYAILELVLEQRDDRGMVVARYGVGWTMLSVFNQASGLLIDAVSGEPTGENSRHNAGRERTPMEATNRAADRRAAAKSRDKARKFYAGSPRVLLVINSDDDWRAKLQTAAGPSLWYQLCTHSGLEPLAHLIPEHDIISPHNLIGGLPLPEKRLPESPTSERFSLFAPGNMPSFNLRVIKPRVTLPNGFERHLLDNFGDLYRTLWEDVLPDERLAASVVSRRLLVGVHNGRTFLREPAVLVLERVDEGARHGGRAGKSASRVELSFEGTYDLRDIECMVENDPLVALVFDMTYVLKVEREGNHAPVTRQVSVGWAPRLMGNGDLALDGTLESITMERGPGQSPSDLLIYSMDEHLDRFYKRNAKRDTADASALFYEKTKDIVLTISVFSQELAAISSQAVASARNEVVSNEPSSAGLPVDAPPPERAPREHLRTPKRDVRARGHARQSDRYADVDDVPPTPSHMDAELLREREPMYAPDDYGQRKVGIERMAPSRTVLPKHTMDLLAEVTRSSVLDGDSDVGPNAMDTHIQFVFAVNEYRQPHARALGQFSLPESIIVSFQFYNFPPFVSKCERLTMRHVSDLQEGGGRGRDGYESGAMLSTRVNSAGRLVTVDDFHSNELRGLEYTARVALSDRTALAAYLYTKDLRIDVWDGDSLFHLGTATLPLYMCLRQGKRSVQRTYDVEIRQDMHLRRLSATSSLGAMSGTGGVMGMTDDLTSIAAASQLNQPGPGALDQLGDAVHVGGLQLTVRHGLISVDPTRTVSRGGTGVPADAIAVEARRQAAERALLQPDTIPSSVAEALLDRAAMVQYLQRVGGRSKRKGGEQVEADRRLLVVPLGEHMTEHRTVRAAPASVDAVIEAANKRAVRTNQGSMRPKRAQRAHRKKQLRAKPIGVRLPSRDDPDMEAVMAKRAAELERIKRERESSKEAFLSAMVRETLVTTRRIRPSFGEMVFFEVCFTNPYPTEASFLLEVRDPLLNTGGNRHGSAPAPELHLVQDAREWQYLKRRFGLSTPMPPPDRIQDMIVGTRQLLLRANETVFVPFYFQSFAGGALLDDPRAACGNVFPLPAGARVVPPMHSIQSRIVQIDVLNSQHVTLASLNLDVDPRPFAVDRVVRLHHWEGEVLKHDFPLSQLVRQSEHAAHQSVDVGDGSMTAAPVQGALEAQVNLDIAQAARVSKVRCSSDDVALSFRDGNIGSSTAGRTGRTLETTMELNLGATGDYESEYPLSATATTFGATSGGGGGGVTDGVVSIRCSVESYPTVTRFYLLLYSDVYGAHLKSVVEVHVHSQRSCELQAAVGQDTRESLLLPRTTRLRRVRAFASRPRDFSFDDSGGSGMPSETFDLPANTSAQPLGFVFNTTIAQQSRQLIHLVDVDVHELVQSWMMSVYASYPTVTNEYTVTVRLGEPCRKHLDFNNTYNRTATYTVTSSQPDRVAVQQEEMRVPAHTMVQVPLFFESRQSPGQDVVFIFFNNERGKNEACMRLTVIHTG